MLRSRYPLPVILFLCSFILPSFQVTLIKIGGATNTFAQSVGSGTVAWQTQPSTTICSGSPFASAQLNNQKSFNLFIGNWSVTTAELQGATTVDWIIVTLNDTATDGVADNVVIRLKSSCGAIIAQKTANQTSRWLFSNLNVSTSHLQGVDFGFEIAKFGSAFVELACITIQIQLSNASQNAVDCSAASPSANPSLISPSSSPSSSPSVLPSRTPSPSASPTITPTTSATPSVTPSQTPSASVSPSASRTPSSSASTSATSSPTTSTTPSPTNSPSNSYTPHPSTLLEPSASPSMSVSPREDSSGSKSKKDNLGAVIGGAVGGAVVLCAMCAVMVFFVMVRRKKNRKNEDAEVELANSTNPVSDRPNSGLAADPHKSKSQSFFDEKDIYIKDVSLKGLLGKGKFGEVYEGVWSGTTPIALKKLKKEDQQEFENEIILLRRLNHPNVVRCLGIWVNPETAETFMALELLRLGSLTSFLRKQNKLTPAELVEMCANVASGMIYLEQKNIVHRDLGCRNLLITESEGRYVVKVSDFGLSREVEENDAVYSSKEGVFPVKWSPPEVISFRQFTSKSDVWSFGITMWEIFEFGSIPYPTMSNEDCVAQVMKGYRLPCPESCPEAVYKVMLSCWAHSPALRPSFKQIYEQLSLTLKELRGVSPNEPENQPTQESDNNNANDDTYQTSNSTKVEVYNSGNKLEDPYHTKSQPELYNSN